MVTARTVIDLIEDLWSGDVKAEWKPPDGLFTKSADEIASIIQRNSKDLKQAMARLNFYRNRSGSNLTPDRKRALELAAEILKTKMGS